VAGTAAITKHPKLFGLIFCCAVAANMLWKTYAESP
jgi:hypothetical protein